MTRLRLSSWTPKEATLITTRDHALVLLASIPDRAQGDDRRVAGRVKDALVEGLIGTGDRITIVLSPDDVGWLRARE